VHEGAGYYEFLQQDKLIALHPRTERHSVVMEPGHYAGLLRNRLGGRARAAATTLPSALWRVRRGDGARPQTLRSGQPE
jgi:hypothetical protein